MEKGIVSEGLCSIDTHPILWRVMDTELRLSQVAAPHNGMEVIWDDELRLAVADLEIL